MRECGILLPVFSLRGPYGIGTLGHEAREWIDYLAKSGVAYWQILPIGPTGFGNSPYQPFSSFAGNPLLISPDLLAEDGLLTKAECTTWHLDKDKVDYGRVCTFVQEALRTAFSRFHESEAYHAFCRSQSWLDDYALFMASKTANDQAAWYDWEEGLRLHRADALERAVVEWEREIRFHKFVQYEFYRQWQALHDYAKKRKVSLIGDMPIYIALDSADAWAEPDQFQLDDAHKPVAVAGCPPDYFSEEGQLWGNPLYDWKAMQRDGYRWWRARFRHAAELFDGVRIDHFRGFASYWSVPAGAKSAKSGQWIPGPGMDLFRSAAGDIGACKIIAEDLGIITDEVRQLLKESGFPGMSVLQFAFVKGKISEYLPFRQKENSVCYTGTHDNDSLLGWLDTLDEKTKEFVYRYTHTDCDLACADALIDMAWSSPASLCVVPLQDLLHLGGESRINTPSVCEGNWAWRMPRGALTKELSQSIIERNETFFR